MDQVATQKIFPSWLKTLFTFGPPVLGVILSVGLAYGAAKLAEGETRKSIQTLEKQQDQMVTREELRQYIEATREDLREIKQNIRDIRSEVLRK